jgi:hypothetical protein
VVRKKLGLDLHSEKVDGNRVYRIVHSSGAHASGLGSAKHADFAMGVGEMTEIEYVAFLSNVLASLAAHSRSGSIHYVFMSWHHLFELLTAGRRVYDELKNICVWV